jgi:hypothetical protein
MRQLTTAKWRDGSSAEVGRRQRHVCLIPQERTHGGSRHVGDGPSGDKKVELDYVCISAENAHRYSVSLVFQTAPTESKSVILSQDDR